MRRYRWLLLIVMLALVISGFYFKLYPAFDYAPATVSANFSLEEGDNLGILRVMTYNIHLGKGIDGNLDLSRIATVIEDAQVDLVGLNEVDYLMPRTGLVNQIKALGGELAMHTYYAPALSLGFGRYGNGVLSRFPITNPTTGKLPKFMNREPRSFAWFQMTFQSQPVQVLVTHLGLNPVERQQQLDYLAELVNQLEDPVILMGDFNLTPTAPAMQAFLRQTGLDFHSNEPTYASQKPEYKIDYILTSQHWELVGEVEPIPTLASDHLPLVGSFKLKGRTTVDLDKK